MDPTQGPLDNGPNPGNAHAGQINTDHAIADFFIREAGLQRMLKTPQSFDAWLVPKTIFLFTGQLKPQTLSLILSETDYGTLIHSSCSEQPSRCYGRLTGTFHTKIDLSKEETTARLCRLASITLGPALNHLTACESCKESPVDAHFNVLLNGLEKQRLSPEVMARSLEHMGSIQTVLRGQEQRGRFVQIIRLFNLRMAPLAEMTPRAQFGDQLLSMALTMQKAGRSKAIHDLSIKTADKTEKERIEIHVRRRFRWLYFLMVSIQGRDCEIRLRGATKQDQKGTTSHPACHSLLGDIDCREEDWGWRLSDFDEIFKGLPFHRAITCTVILPKWCNDIDCKLESALRLVAGDLITTVAKGTQKIPDTFESICEALESWAKEGDLVGQEKAYIQAHLDEIEEIRKDEKRLLGPCDVDDFYRKYVEPAEDNNGNVNLEAIQQRILNDN